jgi:hypothetical protein
MEMRRSRTYFEQVPIEAIQKLIEANLAKVEIFGEGSHGAGAGSNWRELYRATVLETDLAALHELILETEDAILARLQALTGAPDADAERREIAEVAPALLNLKTERLGWPNWESKAKTGRFGLS